jgi:hypothetical protein
MELLIEGGMIPRRRLEKLLDEAYQVTAIMVSSRKSASRRIQKSKFKNQIP